MTYLAFIILAIYNYILFANKRYKVIFLFFIISLLVLFSGFRSENGLDYNNYLILYNESRYASSEYLYWFISILHKDIFDSFRLFVFMSSLILIFMKVYFLNKLSDHIFLTIFIFICISFIYVDMGLISRMKDCKLISKLILGAVVMLSLVSILVGSGYLFAVKNASTLNSIYHNRVVPLHDLELIQHSLTVIPMKVASYFGTSDFRTGGRKLHQRCF